MNACIHYTIDTIIIIIINYLKYFQVKAFTSAIGGEVSVKVPFKMLRPYVPPEEPQQPITSKPPALPQVN